MTDIRTQKQCDRCGARPAAGNLFRIPWTGDLLCKKCIDKDSSLQRMFAEIDSMSYDRHLRDLGIRTDRTDTLAYIIEPDEN